MKLSSITFAICIATASMAVSAENLAIPGHYVDRDSLPMPHRGMSMQRVLEEYGEPYERRGPVGEPPITEWSYDGYKVYFEFQTVLHAVDLTTLITPAESQ